MAYRLQHAAHRGSDGSSSDWDSRYARDEVEALLVLKREHLKRTQKGAHKRVVKMPIFNFMKKTDTGA